LTVPTVETVLDQLDAGPKMIADAVAGVASKRLAASPAPGEWSAVEVLAHLRACADVWGDYIRTILTEDRPTIRAVSPRSWRRLPEYVKLSFPVSFNAFSAQRNELLDVLRPLRPADWSRTATVRGAGSPLTKSVFDYAERLARHERPHVNQIRAAAR
jgi:hypothetical protein